MILGLGNPGKKYEHTRHNVWFFLLDQFFLDWKEVQKFKSMISENCTWSLAPGVLAAKPQTFMNLSGEAVSSLVNFYKLDPKSDILVISDDIDMEFGKVRYRSQWSHGGQNWLRDIITKLGTSEFARIKIGIGRDPRYDVSDWVLSSLTLAEREHLASETTLQVQEYLKTWLWE